MLQSAEMPPADADLQPSAAERAAALAWVQTSLKAFERDHAGEPGRVTVRRLTSGEFTYAIRDLTGVDFKGGPDASSDAVGGEGFTNVGDVQFVQDASIERYLEAAKQVAEHAVIGAGPLEFSSDTGKSGLELSALARINELYATRGFRVVSGEGGRPFGLERYGKAFFVAWYFQHRAALGDPRATLRGLAAREGITGRFADHIWSVVNRPGLGYPTSEMVNRWKALPVPSSDVAASLARARTATDELYKYLTTWPSWFFARGDLAAGGAGDESPLAFDDESLRVESQRRYAYAPGQGGGRGIERSTPVTPRPGRIFITFANMNPNPAVQPVILWRNAQVVTRAGGGAGGGRGGRGGRGGAGGGGRGRGGAGGAILSTEPLRNVLPPEVTALLGFGRSPDGSTMGPDDFAITGPVAFELPAPPAGGVVEFQADAELGADRNGVVRVTVTERAEGTPRDARTRTVFADRASQGYQAYRAGMAEYASLLPPNSHGEANPADKDPVPAPFDNSYNSPEHDAFVIKVKYQRTDAFFTENLVDGADRDRLNQAWHDLLGSWPYHNAYLGLLAEHYKVDLRGRGIADFGPGQVAALPEAMRDSVTALRKHYDDTMKALVAAQPGHVDDAVAFASRAWRRPVTNAEKARLKSFYLRSRAENGLDHESALRALLARILVSPSFLYRMEPVADRGERALNGWELASRLSFFLWASVPDDELRRAAAAGELAKPALLARQVQRMSADPKARRLATEFFGQWLGFYGFDEFRGVDTTRFPEFTPEVRTAMYEEAVATFEHLVREKRPLKELLHADYTFLNEPLAKFYGVSAELTTKDSLMKVEGANAFNRGGALRLGAILTATSAPLRTSPVKRGDWLLRRILGTPTPPPPADAGSLPSDPANFGGLTLRARLDEHKRNPACANCHLRIDPLGFPLEEFDAVGRTREKYPDGAPVDVTGEFADKSTIVGAKGLLTYLQSRDELVRKTFARKLLGYALGRAVQASDRPLIDELVAAGDGASFSDLAIRIVASRQFRHRQGVDDPAPNAVLSQASP